MLNSALNQAAILRVLWHGRDVTLVGAFRRKAPGALYRAAAYEALCRLVAKPPSLL